MLLLADLGECEACTRAPFLPLLSLPPRMAQQAEALVWLMEYECMYEYKRMHEGFQQQQQQQQHQSLQEGQSNELSMDIYWEDDLKWVCTNTPFLNRVLYANIDKLEGYDACAYPLQYHAWLPVVCLCVCVVVMCGVVCVVCGFCQCVVWNVGEAFFFY